MDELDILQAVDEGEAADWEFKDARGGLPRNTWDTYSGMANTEGGVIVLGVAEGDDSYVVVGLPNPQQTLREFWNNVRNHEKVSICLVAEQDVRPVEVGGHTVLVVRVPRATRQQRPVYHGNNPLTGTYRRNYDGDYRCTAEEAKRMLAEQSGESLDAAILEGFSTDDLDRSSIQQFRQRWASRTPDHPFLSLDDAEFLTNLGAYRCDRVSNTEGLTVAGLLMFGKSNAITDPDGVPGFNLDYREFLSDSPGDRWTDRVTYDGTWECNLFQFVERVLPKLTSQVPVRFQLQADLSRSGESEVREALREAFVNALIHADYRGQGGVVIERYRNRFKFSNPGTLLVSIEQVYHGTVSECRNKTLQKMFGFLGYGERAGSGFPRILRGWQSQHWRWPQLWETVQPNRVNLQLEMISLLPEESLERLRERFGDAMDGLSGLETQALVTAELDGGVSNSRMQQISTEHPSDLTRMLQGLVTKDLLEQRGHKRGTTYRLAEGLVPSDLAHKEDLSHTEEPDLAHKAEALSTEEDAKLRELAGPVSERSRVRSEEMHKVILELCDGRYLSATQLGDLLDRNPRHLQRRVLSAMVSDGLLEWRFPGEPNRPDQAYTAARGTDDE